MRDKWHWLRHKWTRWTQYEEKFSFVHNDGRITHGYRTEIRQQRKCIICGTIRDEMVAYDARLQSEPICGDVYADYTKELK